MALRIRNFLFAAAFIAVYWRGARRVLSYQWSVNGKSNIRVPKPGFDSTSFQRSWLGFDEWCKYSNICHSKTRIFELESPIRLDESMESYDSTSNIRIFEFHRVEVPFTVSDWPISLWERLGATPRLAQAALTGTIMYSRRQRFPTPSVSLFIAILEHTFITSCDSTIFRIAELELYFVRFIKIVGFFSSDENLFWCPRGKIGTQCKLYLFWTCLWNDVAQPASARGTSQWE